jgi:hypothetical protein
MRLLALAMLACAVVPAAALAKTTSKPATICSDATPPESCSGYYATAPAHITFGSNAAYSVAQLKWSRWGSSTTTASGQAFYRYYTNQPRVRLTALKLAYCGSTRAYTELQIVTGKKTVTYTGCELKPAN